MTTTPDRDGPSDYFGTAELQSAPSLAIPLFMMTLGASVAGFAWVLVTPGAQVIAAMLASWCGGVSVRELWREVR